MRPERISLNEPIKGGQRTDLTAQDEIKVNYYKMLLSNPKKYGYELIDYAKDKLNQLGVKI
jgi:hypothetical protein